ncbi:hypothetical protein [Streptomyces scabiei]|uniref:hypothetical protein n=1 Tax=Streptomyces scabiei TaxID=1930 RepID=UPI0029ADFA65|nr:hypothetical protein [Streptomyces scabiei]MDX2531580.1 hypothetical protein [Streptomyces scabiei]MDX2796638.1 hypothetical protein [Streptomyces scabiei]MDX2855874.1 hypothetical protein [Streptomyces scabiei]MDX3824574.1 hypothetical protein [Streptomyces scabiei]
MMVNPDMVFSTDPRHGLLARSGWEQVEARAVLRDLGWKWEEELHALVPPDNTLEVDAGIQAVEELHLHGYRTGYSVGPYGTMRLSLARAEQVFTKLAAREIAEIRPAETFQDVHQAPSQRRSTYGGSTGSLERVPEIEPDGPGI